MRIKKIIKPALIMMLAVSISISPVWMPEFSYADNSDAGEDSSSVTAESVADTNLDGKNVLALMLNSEKKEVLQDPMFYRYYDISMFGQIKKKTVEDDMSKYNTPSADSADIEAEVLSDMNSIGCGVSGLGKAQVPSKYKSYTKYNCLDISEWQGKISAASWKKIKAAGVTHVIIRVGASYLKTGKSFSDTYYGTNINNAYSAGLKVGVYYFSQALTTSEAQNEAAYTIKIISSYKNKITMPVVFDYESNESGRLTGSKLKSLGKSGTAYKICKAFSEKVKSAGYTPMVYANYNTLVNYLDYKTLQKNYKIWLANYTTSGSATTYPGEYYVWQYSSSGKVNGLSGYVDMNYIFEKKGSSTQTDVSEEPGDGSSQPASASEDDGTDGTAQTTETPTTAEKATTAAESTKASKSKVKKVKRYKVKLTKAVNYRNGPGSGYAIKGRFKKGKIVTITGKGNIGKKTWGRTASGYYIPLTNTKKYGYVVKTKNKVNYRSGPGLKYKVKGKFKKGKILTIVKNKNGWGKTEGGNYIKLTNVKKIY